MLNEQRKANDTVFSEFDEEIFNHNFTTIKQISAAGLIVTACLLLVEIFTNFSSNSFIIYLSWCAACLTLFVANNIFSEFCRKHSTGILYLFLTWVTIASIISGTVMHPDNNSVVVIGYLCIIPFILLDKVFRFCLFEICMCVLFCIVSLLVKKFSIAFMDCVQAVAFTMLACILGTNTIQMKLTAIESTATIISQRDTDPLTTLLTRRASGHCVNGWLDNGVGKAVFVLMDLDHFKTINDTLGHLQGDKVLSQTAMVIRHFFRNSDCVARLGGDEFLIFLPEITDVHSVQEKLEALIKDVYHTITHENSCYVISASGGMTICHPGESYDTVYQRADSALYKAKSMGKNRLCVFEDDLHHTTNIDIK